MDTRFRRGMTPAGFLQAWLEEHGLEGLERKTFEDYYRSYRARFPALLQQSYNRRLAPAERIIRAAPGPLRVLEVGSGCGTESLYFALLGARVTGVEVYHKMVLTARARKDVLQRALGEPLACEFHHGNVLDFVPREPFDLIWMEEAFHHLEPRARVVEKIAALLRPGGNLVVAETNWFNPLVQLQLFRRRGLPSVYERRDETGQVYQHGDERILPPFVLERWLRPQGIVRSEVVYHRFFPNVLHDSRLLQWLDATGHRWMPRFLKRLCCVHYNFVGRRNVGGAEAGAHPASLS